MKTVVLPGGRRQKCAAQERFLCGAFWLKYRGKYVLYFSGRVIRSVFFGVCAGSGGEKWSSIRIRSQKQDLHN